MIRPAGKDDADILRKIHAECFPTYGNIESFNNFFSIDGTLALLAEEVLGASCLVLGKQADNSPSTKHQLPSTSIGMTVYRIVHEQADIITIAVLPAFQRRGIAGALLRQVLENMLSRGVRTVFLDVEEGNAAGINLYEKHGFTSFKRRKQYYKQRDGSFTDALVMMRKLG